MKKFDYVILTADNQWLSTGKQETQKQLEEELERVREEMGEDVEITIFKAKNMEQIDL